MATRDRPAGLGSADSRSDPYDAFVSYSRRDTDAAERIAVTLRDRGLRVFLDRWCLHAGERWLPEIEDALGQCPAVVIVVGPSGLGDWQQGETELALDRQRRGEPVRVVPVLLPMSEPPLGFLRLNSWIDLRDGVGESGLERLARAVAGEVEPAQLRICPYRGLRPFRREDAEFFFGRDEFVDRAIPLLERGGITAVVGASGSGKSSAVHAGVLPRLGRSDPSVRWDVAVMTPGRTPVHGLAASLHDLRGPGVATDEERLRAVRSLGDALRTDELRLEAVADDLLRREGAGDRLLVVVDQWEELYTLCGDPDARALFIESLLRATEDPRVGALLTVRGDFFDDVLEHRGLADRLEGRGLNLGPMNDEELRQCIEEPAHRVGLSFEDGLVDRILEDVRGEPGSLPLLEFVLQQLWKARRGNQLVHDAYRAMGEVRGALATHADARFAALSADQQKSARRIFLQLVQTTAARTATRRRATRAEIGEAGWPVVLALADARLLVTGRLEATDEETVEVAHEALIRHWERLRGWIDQDREFLLWRRRLGAALEQHAAAPRDIGTLLRGSPLREAQGWRARREGDLSSAELAFISRSAQRAKRLRRRYVVAGGAALFALGAVVLLAERYRDQLGVARLLHEGRVLREAADHPDPLIAALLASALDGRASREPPDGARNARRIADRAIPLATLSRDEGRLTAAALAPEGDRVLTGYEDGAVLLWPADDSGPPATLAGLRGSVRSAAWSGDGGRMLVLGDGGELRLFDGAGAPVPAPWPDSGTDITAARFIDAGATGAGATVATIHADSAVRIWPVTERGPPTRLRVGAGEPRTLVPSPDGTRLAVLADSLVEVWDLQRTTGPIRTLRGHTDRVVAAAFTPDGAVLATASHDGTVRRWDVESGAGQVVLTSADGGAAWSVAFLPDGETIVAGFHDSRARVWSGGRSRELVVESAGAGGPGGVQSGDFSGPVWLATPHPDRPWLAMAGTRGGAWLRRTDREAPPVVLGGHGGDVFAVAFSRDGRRLMTASRDGEIRLWHGTGRPDPAVLDGTLPPCVGAVSADARRVAIGCEDGGVRVADTESLNVVFEATLPGGAISALALDGEGSRLAAGSWAGDVVVWDVDAGTRLGTRTGHRAAVAALAFRGRELYSASHDSTVRSWAPPDYGSWAALGRHDDLIQDVVPVPGDGRVATASADGTVRLWDPGGDAGPVTLGLGDELVRSVTFAPDGRTLLAVTEGPSTVWTPGGTQTPLGDAIRALDVSAGSFDARGDRLVTGSRDGTTRVWDASGTGDPLLLEGHTGPVRSARFDPVGRSVATGGSDSTARVHPLDGAEPIVLHHPVATVRDARFTGDGRLLTITERGARLWRIGWPQLHAYLTAATTACLSVADRMRFLREGSADARAAFERCERRWGRDTTTDQGGRK